MRFWNEPIEIRRLWRGPLRRGPFSTVCLTGLGRHCVIAFLAAVGIFAFVALAFEIALCIHDPVIGLGSIAIVLLVALVIARVNRRRAGDYPEPPPFDSGVPLPRVPGPPVAVGANPWPDFDESAERVG